MKIYIGNLSKETTSFDLAEFFKGYGEYPSFKFKYYEKGSKRFYYALTAIEPDSLAKQAIARRHMKRIKGRFIALHEFKERVLFNERRSVNWRNQAWALEERRQADRRHVQYDKHVESTKTPEMATSKKPTAEIVYL